MSLAELNNKADYKDNNGGKVNMEETKKKRDYNDIRKNFYHKYTKEETVKQLKAFIEQDVDLSNFDNKGKRYDKIINAFFEKNIYSAKNSRCKISPNQALYDDELLERMYNYIDTKPKFYTGDDIANLRTFFRNAGKWACKVANFSPNVARKIYERYMPKHNAYILDYSCGFGSRMLGCLSSKNDYTYFGIDPNTKLCKRLNMLGEFINEEKPCNYKIYCQGSEQKIDELVNMIDLAFSSPPYFNLETYTDESTQSTNKFSNYELWLNQYVEPTIKNIYNYLKNDGLFILNIKNLTRGNKEPLLDDWIKIAETNGFELVEMQEMKHQSSKKALAKYIVDKGINYKYTGDSEPLAIFKKINSK